MLHSALPIPPSPPERGHQMSRSRTYFFFFCNSSHHQKIISFRFEIKIPVPSFPFLNFRAERSSLSAAFISYIRHVKAKWHITFYNVITSCFEAEKKKNQKQPEYAGTGLGIETRRGSVKTNCENLGTFTLTRMFSVSVLLLPPPALFPRMICLLRNVGFSASFSEASFCKRSLPPKLPFKKAAFETGILSVTSALFHRQASMFFI